MSKIIKIAVIGCGRVSGKHLKAIDHLPDAAVVAVSDSNETQMRKKAGECKCAGYSDYKEMFLKHPEIDVVAICTDSGSHAAVSIDCADAGKHVLVEKPMALTLDDADRMIAKFDEKGRYLFVVKQNRFNPPVVKLHDALDTGRFGKMVLGTVRVRWCRKQDYYDQAAWRGTWALDGGVFANQASHHIDLLLWCMGDVESVFAYSATRLVNIEVEDVGVAILKFSNGALGVIEATTATRPKDLEGSISILGETGSVEIAGFAMNQMKIWNFTEMTDEDAGMVKKYSVVPPDAYSYGHVAIYQQLLTKLTTGKSGGALVDGLSGRKSLELIAALYESVYSGKEIHLKFRPKVSRLGEKPNL